MRLALIGRAARVFDFQSQERMPQAVRIVLQRVWREIEVLRTGAKECPVKVGEWARLHVVNAPEGALALLSLSRPHTEVLYVEDVMVLGSQGEPLKICEEKPSGEAEVPVLLAFGESALLTAGKKALRQGESGTAPSREGHAGADNTRVAWEAAMAYVDRARLWEDERYRGRHVAVRDDAVVDSDDDEFRLADRIAERFPNEVVLIAKAQKDAPVLDLPSPEPLGWSGQRE